MEVEEGMGNAQVGELKAVLLAIKEKERTIYVWANATQYWCQWEALGWQVNGKEVWQKEDWICFLLQAQSQPTHKG